MNTRNPTGKPEPGSTPPAPGASMPLGMNGSRSDPLPERLAYSVDEAARLTGLSRDLLYDQMRRGNLDYIKVGRRRVITRQHLEEFLGINAGPQPSSVRVTASDLRAVADAP